MSSWSLVVDLVRAAVFSAAHLCGNSLGSGILAVSLLIRIALLPLTLRAARRMLAHQVRVAAMAPELAKIRTRYDADRAGAAQATAALYQRNNVGIMPPGAIGTLLVQMPIGAALYQAVGSGLGRAARFLWIGDLARPDAIVAAAAAVLAGVATATATMGGAGAANVTRTGIIVSALMTLALAWRLSASVGLYWVASNSVGVAQGLILRRSAATKRG